MFSVQLFLGFPVDQIFSEKLDQASPALVKEFIRDDGEYLCKFSHNEMCFLGKRLEMIIQLSQIELLEKNIYSLLKKLVPNFPYEETTLYLLSMLDDNT